MAGNKVQVTLTTDERNRIDDYRRVENRRSESDAVRSLALRGLREWEHEDAGNQQANAPKAGK